MARGKGEVAGWITRNGVHIPIYENYSVRGGEEPKAKGSKFKGAGKKRKKPDLNAIKGYASDPRTATGDPTVIKVGNEEYFKSGENRWEKHSVSGRVLSSSISDEKMNDIVQKHDGEVTVMEGKSTKNAATEGESDASKGKQVEGKGAVKDVEGKKETPKPGTAEKNFKEGLKHHSEIQDIASKHNDKVWNKEGGASNQELYDEADKFAEKSNFNKEKVRDAAFSAFIDKWVDTKAPKANQTENAAAGKTAQNGAPRVTDEEAKSNKVVEWEGQKYSTQPMIDWDNAKNEEYVAGHLYVPIVEHGTGKDAHQFFVANEDGSVYNSGSEYLRQKSSKPAITPTSSKDAAAKKEGFFDAEDKKLFDAREKAYETRGLRGQAEKGSIPTTVSGLRSAYSEATGSEKAAIASELRKKGYSLIGGKWVKGK